MSKNKRHWQHAATALVASLAMAPPSQAALVTLSGANFDLTYDTSKLGLFGAPTLAGDSIFFTFSGFAAESLNGAGAVTQNSTISGLVLTARNGFQFGGLLLAEFGDYKLSGAGSTVGVSGQLRAFDVFSPLNTQTVANLQLAPGQALDRNDGALHDWLATAALDHNTPVQALPSMFGLVATNVIAAGATTVGVTIENQLTAYTDAAGTGLQQAFIEKKFAGVQMTVAPVPLPLPSTLMLAALGGMLLLRKRRSH